MEPLRGFHSISYWKYVNSNVLILGEQHLPYPRPNLRDLIEYYLNSELKISYFIESERDVSQGPKLRSPISDVEPLLQNKSNVYYFDIRNTAELFHSLQYRTYQEFEQYTKIKIKNLINTGNKINNENLQRWSDDVLDDWRPEVSNMKRSDYQQLLRSLTVDVNMLNIFLTTLPKNSIIMCGDAHKTNIDDFFSSFDSDSIQLIYKRDDIQGRRIDLTDEIRNVFFRD